jgi:hypothetical protein
MEYHSLESKNSLDRKYGPSFSAPLGPNAFFVLLGEVGVGDVHVFTGL